MWATIWYNFINKNWCSSQEVNWGNVHRHGKIYVIDFMSRMYSMLTGICNIYHLCYDLWFWSAASFMLFIRIYGIQMLLLPCLCNGLLQYLDEAVCWVLVPTIILGSYTFFKIWSRCSFHFWIYCREKNLLSMYFTTTVWTCPHTNDEVPKPKRSLKKLRQEQKKQP